MKNKFITDTLRRWVLLIIIIILGGIFGVISDAFLSGNNLLNIIRQTAIMSIMAIGITFVIVAGEMDLSFSSIASLSAVLNLTFAIQGMNASVSWIIVIVLGLILGSINAFIIVKLKVPSMLGTIGTQLLFGGIVAWIANGGTVWTAKFSRLFSMPGRGNVFGVIPIPVVILVICFIVGLVVLEKTVLGRYFYAVGGNAKAADHAGINANRIKALSFIIAGFASSLAGIVIASQFASATSNVGSGYLFPAIIAVFLGSIFLKDGVPNMWGTMAACLFLQELSNGFSLIGLKYWHEDTTQGLVMIIAIATMIAGKRSKK
jgi:ribose transport system permease protein